MAHTQINKQDIAALISGLVFGVGLLLSGMANPKKVLDFLDVFGFWDPTLALVMGAAIFVALPVFWVFRKKNTSLLGVPVQWPEATQIDRKLVIGGLGFGAGWGLAGFCPGPALVAAAALSPAALVFVIAMAVGILLHRTIHG